MKLIYYNLQKKAHETSAFYVDLLISSGCVFVHIVDLSNDYETAVVISKGELNTQMAFMTGKLKVSGNMAKLMMNQAMLGQFPDQMVESHVRVLRSRRRAGVSSACGG